MNFDSTDHSSITLYFEAGCPRAHRIRMVFEEKDIPYNMVDIPNPKSLPEDLLVIDSSGQLPVFNERDLTLLDATIICEYIDERFPYPPLMPAVPTERARVKTAIRHIQNKWYDCLDRTVRNNKRTFNNAVKELGEDILYYSDIFKQNEFFLHDQISLADCIVAPVLLRLRKLGIQLKQPAIMRYQKRIFSRPSFRRSLTDVEVDLLQDFAPPKRSMTRGLK